MKVLITVDVEEDCPPYLKTTRGMEEGLPKLLDLLREKDIRATFFFTGEMAHRFPEMVRRIVKEGHELGSHSYHHRRLDKMGVEEARKEIEGSLKILRKYYSVVSFRAPNLQLPRYLFSVLRETGIRIDSSKARYKGWKEGVLEVEGVIEVPVSITSSFLRLPWPVQRYIHERLEDPRVFFVHPWEFVPMKGVRADCRFNTGDRALEYLGRVIDYYREKGAQFLRMEDMTPSRISKGKS